MKKGFSRVYVALMLSFLYAPIVVLMVFSFNQSKSRALWTGFTLDWYAKLFTNDAILSALGNTLIIAVISALISTLIGTAAAVGIHAMSRWARSLVMNITYMPVINPEIVTGVSMMLLFVFVRQNLELPIEMGFITLIIAHISFSIPYVIINVLPKLRQMDKNLYDAAMDLGCDPVQAFFKVVLPEISSGVLAGLLMAFTYSLDDFVISYFVSGPKFQTLPIAIYAMTRKKVSPEINALSTIIFLVVLASLMLLNYVEAAREKEKKKGGGSFH